MNINRRVIFIILFTALLLTSGILLREFILTSFVQPIALLLWMGNRLISSIDQATYWGGAIVAMILISLLRLSRQPEVQQVSRARDGNIILDSIHYWRTLIMLTSYETNRLNFLQQSLQTMLKDLSASKQLSQPHEANADLSVQETLALPDSIKQFLNLDPAPNTDLPLTERLHQASAQFSRRWTKRKQDAYYQSIAEVISFMEKQLENEHEQ